MESIRRDFQLSCGEGNQFVQSRDLIGGSSSEILDYQAGAALLRAMGKAGSLMGILSSKLRQGNGKDGKSLHGKDADFSL